MAWRPHFPDWPRVGAHPDASGALVGAKPGLRWRGQRGILGPLRAWRNGRRSRLRIWSRKGWRFKSSRAHHLFFRRKRALDGRDALLEYEANQISLLIDAKHFHGLRAVRFHRATADAQQATNLS